MLDPWKNDPFLIPCEHQNFKPKLNIEGPMIKFYLLKILYKMPMFTFGK